MKHKYTALSLFLALGTVSPLFGVSAETDATTSASTTRHGEYKTEIGQKRNELKDARQNFVTEVKQKKDEAKTELKDKKETVRVEFRSDVARRQVAVVTRVLSSTANRLDKLVQRIESRIQKIKAAGGNTMGAENSVALAKSDLINARAHISVIGSLDLTNSTSTVRVNFDQIKAEAKTVKESLNSAQKNLLAAMKSLKATEKSLGLHTEEGTTTATTTSHEN